VGRHLVAHLQDEGHEVIGLDRPLEGSPRGAPGGGSSGSSGLASRPDYRICRADVTDERALTRVFATVRPEAIIHLAAVSRVGLAWDEPALPVRTNVLGTLAVIQAVANATPETLVLSVGSGDEYGLVGPDDLPVTETVPLRPRNPYAVSKAAQGQLALQMARKKGLRVIHARPFNHIGPGQARGFITADFAAQVAAIELGQAGSVLRVGNLDTRRDYLDVRDVVRAYTLLIVHGEPGEVYNIASGVSLSGREILDTLLEHSSVEVEVRTDPDLFRPAEVCELRGDASRLREATGWEPLHPVGEALRSVLDYWRERLAI